METVIPGIPTAPPANTDNTPAVSTPPPQPGTNPEARLAAIKARVKQAQGTVTKPEAKPETVVTKPGDKPEEKPIETKPDDQQPETDLKVPAKVLKELGRLQSRVRELEPIAKQLESIKNDAELSKELKKLWSGTHEDKVSALAKLSGKDGLDELAAIIHSYYEIEKNTPEDQRVSPETKKLTALIEEQNKKIEALQADLAKGKETSTKTETEQNQQRANEYVKSFIDVNKSKFELCSRADNVAEAIDLASDAALRIIEREKIDIKTMADQKVAEAVYLEALTEVEKEFEATGKRFSKKTEAKPAFDPDRYASFVRPLSKPAITVKAEELSKDPKTRFEQVRQRAIEKAEAGLYRR